MKSNPRLKNVIVNKTSLFKCPSPQRHALQTLTNSAGLKKKAGAAYSQVDAQVSAKPSTIRSCPANIRALAYQHRQVQPLKEVGQFIGLAICKMRALFNCPAFKPCSIKIGTGLWATCGREAPSKRAKLRRAAKSPGCLSPC